MFGEVFPVLKTCEPVEISSQLVFGVVIFSSLSYVKLLFILYYSLCKQV